MTLQYIPRGAKIFADANVLVYAFMEREPFAHECTELLARAAGREIQLFTAVHVAADVIHRVMLIEARTRLALPSAQAVGYLKRHPQAVRQLTEYKRVPGEFSKARIDILPVTYQEIHSSKEFRDDHGLLTNDSIILAVMAREKIVDLATNDPDFRRVPGIRLWTPTG